METITEAMLAILVRHGHVQGIALSRQTTSGPLKREAWGIHVELKLPGSAAAVEAMFRPPGKARPRIRPDTLVRPLARAAAKGKVKMWVQLASHREAIGPPPARMKTVASLDRYINHLRSLGARKIAIKINLGEQSDEGD